ncbi:uncharacterized protein [Miscanthus floridulus]|uniref:uncharacterized protein n=1 Tax=Miscanthus floridulus TaxID=154761 RepID=UPI0034582952
MPTQLRLRPVLALSRAPLPVQFNSSAGGRPPELELGGQALWRCKPWCRIVCGPSFRRRFMEFHRVAPLLGFLCNTSNSNARFVPTSSFRPPNADDLIALHDCEGVEEEEMLWDWDCVALDTRHGLVLLYFVVGEDQDDLLVVWNQSQSQRWCLRVYSSEDASWSEQTLLPECIVET